jgi:hypothetical protein
VAIRPVATPPAFVDHLNARNEVLRVKGDLSIISCNEGKTKCCIRSSAPPVLQLRAALLLPQKYPTAIQPTGVQHHHYHSAHPPRAHYRALLQAPQRPCELSPKPPPEDAWEPVSRPGSSHRSDLFYKDSNWDSCQWMVSSCLGHVVQAVQDKSSSAMVLTTPERLPSPNLPLTPVSALLDIPGVHPSEP